MKAFSLFLLFWIRNIFAVHDTGRRRIASGDFDRFNSLFENASINIFDDIVVSQKVLFATLVMTIDRIKCYGISVGDIGISHDQKNNQEIDVLVDVSQLDVKCTVWYAYEYGFLNGDGAAVVSTDDNGLSTKLNFKSSNFNTSPPRDSTVESCTANIEITELDFHGDFLSDLAEAFEGLIINVIEGEIEKIACDELGSLGTSFISDMLGIAGDLLEQYQGDLEEAVNDPLYHENNAVLPDTLKALDFQDEDNLLVNFFSKIMDEADILLGSVVPDPTGPTQDKRDLGVNVLLRSTGLLDENRALIVDVEELPMDAVLFKGHDRITETTISLNSIKVLGLDTVKYFNPLVDIGKYTIQNSVAWKSLSVEFDVTVDIMPSTLQDAILQDGTSQGISERILINFGVDDVDIVASLFLVINQDELSKMELGPLLSRDNWMPCLLSVIHDIQMSGMHVDPLSVKLPTLSGFVSPGLDRIITNSVHAAFAMYLGVLKEAIPNIFQTSIRNFVNENLIDGFLSDLSQAACPEINYPGGFIDFRDAFLPPEVAKSQGGSGTMPFGDIAYKVKGIINDYLLAIDDGGLLELNSFLVRPITKAQSNTSGTLLFPNDLLSLVTTQDDNNSFFQRFEFALFDPRINNLDILMPPAEILETTNSSDVLTNVLNFGPAQDSINVTLGLRLAVEANGLPWNMHNELDVSIGFGSAGVRTDIFAMVDADRFLHFPLKDVLNPHCWLALIPAPSLDESFRRVAGSIDTLSILDTVVNFADLELGVDIISSTSPGLQVIGTLIELLGSIGGIEVLKQRIGDFTGEILENDWIQMQIDRSLALAPRQCSGANEMTEKTNDAMNPFLPDLSAKTIDSIFFFATFAVQMAYVTLLESQRLQSSENTTALSAQYTLVTSDSYWDLTNLGGKIGKLLDTTLTEAKKYLGGTVEDKSTGASDLGINIFIRNWLLGGNDQFEFKFEDLSFDILGAKIELSSMKVRGLDSFTKFSLWEAIAPQTIQNRVELSKLTFSLEMKVTTIETLQSFTLSFSLDKIKAEIPIFLALNQAELESLPIGLLFQTENILPCLLSIVDSVQLTQMLVSAESFGPPTVEGLMQDTQSTIDDFKSHLLTAYDDVIKEGVPALFDSTIRQLLNKMIKSYLQTNECQDIKSSFVTTMSGFVDFRDLLLPSQIAQAFGGSGTSQYGDLFQKAFGFVRDLISKVDPSTGLPAVNNDLITRLTQSQSGSAGSLLFPGDIFNVNSSLEVEGLDANVQLQVSNVHIDNLDTIGYPLEVLYPVQDQPHELNNTAKIGFTDRPLRVAVNLFVSLMDDEDLQLQNALEISLDLASVTLILKTMMKVAESRLVEFPVGDILDYNCWLATMPAPSLDSYGVRVNGAEPTAALEELIASINSMNLNVSCVDCSSPRMTEWTDVLSKSDAQEELTAVFNSVFDYVTNLVGGDFLQVQIDRLLNQAAKKCPHNPAYNPNGKKSTFIALEAQDNEEASSSFLLMVSVVVGSLVFAIVLLLIALRCFVRRRHRRWLKNLPPHQVQWLAHDQLYEEKVESELNSSTQSMFASPVIPTFVRWGMPLIILGNIAFFLSGHLSLGATVNVEAEFAGEIIRIEKFFEFSMAKSTVDMWNAGGKELAILLLLFSGVWPYTKQIITLYLWFATPSRLSVSRRESILLWLDCLGKWSMIDIFVLVVSVAAFRVSIVSPETVLLPQDFYNVEVLVVPLWGLYANMIAQLISQVSSHFIIHYHRKIVTETTESTDDEQLDCEKKALYEHCFSRPHRGESDKLVVKPWVNNLLLFGVFSLSACLIAGCMISSFSLEVLGLAGIAVESGQNFEDATTEHSIFTVLQLLFEEASFLGTVGGYVGLGSLSVLFIATVLVVPIAQSILLLRQWFKPSTSQETLRMSVIIEILQAWQYAEVYLIAIFVASWQLGPVSEFMVNSYCDPLKGFFADLVYFGLLTEEDAQCFSVKSNLERGSFMLLVAAVLLSLINSFVSKAVVQYSRDNKIGQKKRHLEMRTGFLSNESDRDSDNSSVISHATSRIQPPPVLFTDSFRWMLLRDDQRGASNSFFAAFGYNKVRSSLPLVCDTNKSLSDDIEEKKLEEKMDNSETSESFDSQQAPEEYFEDEDMVDNLSYNEEDMIFIDEESSYETSSQHTFTSEGASQYTFITVD